MSWLLPRRCSELVQPQPRDDSCVQLSLTSSALIRVCWQRGYLDVGEQPAREPERRYSVLSVVQS